MFLPCALSFVYVIISGGPNLASATSLRGNIVIGDQEGQARSVLKEKPIGDDIGFVRSNHNKAESKIEHESRLATACSDARVKARGHTLDGSELQELILAAEIACNTWFAWTDDNAEREIEKERRLATACSDARVKVRVHTMDGSELQELILAAEIACNTWFAWTDDTLPE